MLPVPLNDDWKFIRFEVIQPWWCFPGGFYEDQTKQEHFIGLHIDGYLPEIHTTFRMCHYRQVLKENGMVGTDFSPTFCQKQFWLYHWKYGNTSRFNSSKFFKAGGASFYRIIITQISASNSMFSKVFNVAFFEQNNATRILKKLQIGSCLTQLMMWMAIPNRNFCKPNRLFGAVLPKVLCGFFRFSEPTKNKK